MRKALIPAFLLVLGSAVLGATVMHEPIAHAGSAMSVLVANSKTTPVPVSEQNLDASGNIKVHEQGTANVNVNGVITTQQASPPHSFSKFLKPPQGGAIDGCGENLPAGTRWYISSFAVTNEGGAVSEAAQLGLFEPGTPAGPELVAGPDETAQLTFPQPYVLTSSVAGSCLYVISEVGEPLKIVVGYRQ
jgi:hypothetical protein